MGDRRTDGNKNENENEKTEKIPLRGGAIGQKEDKEEEEDDKKLASTITNVMSESKQVFELASKLVSPNTHEIRIRLVS